MVYIHSLRTLFNTTYNSEYNSLIDSWLISWLHAISLLRNGITSIYFSGATNFRIHHMYGNICHEISNYYWNNVFCLVGDRSDVACTYSIYNSRLAIYSVIHNYYDCTSDWLNMVMYKIVMCMNTKRFKRKYRLSGRSSSCMKRWYICVWYKCERVSCLLLCFNYFILFLFLPSITSPSHSAIINFLPPSPA